MAPLGPPAAFPDVDLPGLDGRRRRLAEAWARATALIAVGHSECGTTRLALPFVDRIHRRRPPTAAAVAILQDDAKAARALVDELRLQLPVLLEEDPYPLAARIGLGTVPTLFIVSPEGRIEAVAEGFRRADLEAFAARLEVPPPFFVPGDDAPPLRPG
jgi:AhpC/TSA family